MSTTEQQAVTVAQEARRVALIERIGTIADQACSTPLAGELGDVAYDLLRQAAAQISSDRQHTARLASVSSASAETRVREAFSGVMRAEVVDAGAWSLHLDFGRGDGARDRMRAASSLLRSIVTASPEPVPATNQAGEVERLADVLHRAAWGTPLPKEGDQGGTIRTIYLRGMNAVLAALATQPATSQEELRKAFRNAARGHGRAGTADLPGGPDMSMDDAADVYATLVAAQSQSNHQMQRVTSCVEQFRNAPFRSADWLAGELMKICETAPDNDIQPAPPQEEVR